MIGNLNDLLDKLSERKNDNEEVATTVEQISAEDINALNKKIGWHSTVTNSAIWLLTFALSVVASASVYGYLRLEDRISNETHLMNQRFDTQQQFITQRMDNQQQFALERMDKYLDRARDPVDKREIPAAAYPIAPNPR